ncbi:hypothetical protein KIN20_009140 [Parelaphostrongylus tenuis]|uniref:Uncharacterized protein n=1 Tax=Parelaphostrongylus tenuis TaxID=148309 RepID=A0AAD5M5V7_PARTN|nr:hypothetical protein KIN20_009140 [Parelaphostrongylus tenuis]
MHRPPSGKTIAKTLKHLGSDYRFRFLAEFRVGSTNLKDQLCSASLREVDLCQRLFSSSLGTGPSQFTVTCCLPERPSTPNVSVSTGQLESGDVTQTSLQSHPASRQREAACWQIDDE